MNDLLFHLAFVEKLVAEEKKKAATAAFEVMDGGTYKNDLYTILPRTTISYDFTADSIYTKLKEQRDAIDTKMKAREVILKAEGDKYVKDIKNAVSVTIKK